MEAIIFNEVSKVFDNGEIGVEKLSFRINRGEFVFIIGRSGAGKSTLLKLISQQIHATSGTIWVNGKDIAELTRKELPYFHRQIGIMQPEFGLLDDRSLFDNVELAMKATEQSGKKARRRVTQILNIMGIGKRAKFYPREVSMGEAARAMLARAMAINPSILLADEPTANLDSDAAWDIMCLLEELNRLGVTVIVASHNQELVSIMRKRVMTLALGKLVADEKHAVYNVMAADVIEERRVLNERSRKI